MKAATQGKRAAFSRLKVELDRLAALRQRAAAPAAPSAGAAGAPGGGDGPLRELRRILVDRPRAPRTATPPGAVAPIVYSRELPRQPAPPACAPAAAGTPLPLEQAVAGVERTAAVGRGVALEITTAVEALDAGHGISAAFAATLDDVDSPLGQRLAALSAPGRFAPEDVLFLDLETTGLTNSPLFLVGVMLWSGGGLEVRQYFARHYGEEAACLALFREACAGRRLLVTFNGKSFDFPYVRARAAVAGVALDVAPVHLDLLHESRRIWGRELPDCRLQTLERHVCGRARHADIPGHAIPEAYHAFVRTGDARDIAGILRHNLLDLVTLAELMTRFA